MMQLLYSLVSLYEVVLIIRVLMSWIRPDPHHPVVYWMGRLTEPVLEPVRRLLPANGMGLDLSPLIVLLILHFIKNLLLRSSMGMFM